MRSFDTGSPDDVRLGKFLLGLARVGIRPWEIRLLSRAQLSALSWTILNEVAASSGKSPEALIAASEASLPITPEDVEELTALYERHKGGTKP